MLFRYELTNWKTLDRLKTAIPKKARTVLKEAGHIFIEKVDKQVGRLTRSKRKGFRKRDRRSLRGSFKLRSVSDDTLQITSAIPWARIHDVGDTIRPTKAKNLCIPIPGTGEHITKGELDNLIKTKATFLSRSGRAIMLKTGRKEAIPIFALVKEVDIDARNYIAKARAAASPRIRKLFMDAYKEGV